MARRVGSFVPKYRALLWALAALLLATLPLRVQAPGNWTFGGDLNQARSGQVANPLSKGWALVVGGLDASRHSVAIRKLYNPWLSIYTQFSGLHS